jgi:hypothetical protein
MPLELATTTSTPGAVPLSASAANTKMHRIKRPKDTRPKIFEESAPRAGPQSSMNPAGEEKDQSLGSYTHSGSFYKAFPAVKTPPNDFRAELSLFESKSYIL